MADYPGSSIDWCCKYKNKAGGRPWLWHQRFFQLSLQSYRVLGRIASFRLVLKTKDPPGSIESLYLPLGHSLGQIQSGWIVGIWGERPNAILIYPCPESLFSFCSRYHLQRPWSFQGSSRGNSWIPAKSSTRLRRGVVYVGALAGWPIYAETKLQMEFCLVLCPLRFWNGPCIAGRTDSNLCVNYYSRGLETELWRAVLVIPVLEGPLGSGPAIDFEQTILEPI